MSEMPPSGHPSAPGPAGYPIAMPPGGSWGPIGPQPSAKPARWPVVVMFLITLVSVGAAVGAWLRPIQHETPAAPATPTYTEQQISDSKSKVCAAFENVWSAEKVAGGRSGGSDPVATLAVATSIRQVLDFGSRYLIHRLGAEPAAPPELASAIRRLSQVYEDLTINYLDGLTNDDPKLGPLLTALDKSTYAVQGLCN